MSGKMSLKVSRRQIVAGLGATGAWRAGALPDERPLAEPSWHALNTAAREQAENDLLAYYCKDSAGIAASGGGIAEVPEYCAQSAGEDVFEEPVGLGP